MKTKRITQSNRLGAYLTATVGIGCLAGNADAASHIIDIDISAFTGTNGGVSSDSSSRFDFAGVTNGLQIYNAYNSYWGLDGDYGVRFAVNSSSFAAIRNFASGATIDGAATFSGLVDFTMFSYDGTAALDFGPNSFVGFVANGNYGWLEVTWDSGTDTFEILDGAYDDTGAPILAGAGASAVPEPASLLSTMGLLASGLLIRRRKLAA